MVWRVAFGAAIAMCLVRAGNALALSASLVDRAERATALVEVKTSEGRAFGSAFCINDKSTFVTDGHVVAQSTGSIKLVMRPGEKDELALTGHVLGIDYDADLAVIQTDKPGQAAPLMLGSSDNLSPTQEVTAFGYPFGKMLALDTDAYPSVTVSTGKVTALRKEKGDLRLIQVDALVNPGDSGGPVLDNAGQVVGLVESGVPGAGLNFATPVSRLKKMLQGPLVTIDPIVIEYAQRTKPQAFSVHVNSLSHQTGSYDVELKITDTKKVTQMASGKTSGGQCDLQLTPTTDQTAIAWNPFVEAPPEFSFTLTLRQSEKVVLTEQGSLLIANIPLPGGVTIKGSGGKHKEQNPLDPLPANALETAIIGPGGAKPMREVNPDGELATGVVYTTGQWEGKTVIDNMHLIHSKAHSGKGESVTAKKGYVVGGLIVETGAFLHGFRVIFIRHKNGKLDPSDTYTSDWVGNSTTGKTKQLAGNGEQVIGLCGRRGVFMRAIGLVIEKTQSPPATQPAQK